MWNRQSTTTTVYLCIPRLQNAQRLKQTTKAGLLRNRTETTALVILHCRPVLCSPQKIFPVNLLQRKYPWYEENTAFCSTAICGIMKHIKFCIGMHYCTKEMLFRFVKKFKNPDGKHTNLARHTISSFAHSKQPHRLQVSLHTNSYVTFKYNNKTFYCKVFSAL